MHGATFLSSRSLIMSRIKSKDTKPELAVRRFLHARGFRYALHRRDLPGTPDIVLPKYRTVVFVHGCLWHGHIPCAKYLPPRTRREYWIPKIRANRLRDALQRRDLRRLGWRVIVVWECQAREDRLLSARLRRLLLFRLAASKRSRVLSGIAYRIAIALFELRSIGRRIARVYRRIIRRPQAITVAFGVSVSYLNPLAELREP
jgi:DNA mismatch endonuclease, patch repair protein